MIGLPDGEKSLTICLPVSTECTNVTDKQTDRHTDRQTDTAWRQKPRGKNGFYNSEIIGCKIVLLAMEDQEEVLYDSSNSIIFTHLEW